MEDFLKMLIPIAIGGVGVPLVIWAWQRFLPRRKVYMTGFKIGRFVTGWGDMKLGKDGWSKVEDSAIVTIYDFCDGFRDGARPEEKPEPTPPESN